MSPRPEKRRAPRHPGPKVIVTGERPAKPEKLKRLQRWWEPTPKWWAQLVSGLGAIAGSWIVTGAFDDVERGMAATLIVTCTASWLKSNDADRSSWGRPR
jgi:hypothetical protein